MLKVAPRDWCRGTLEEAVAVSPGPGPEDAVQVVPGLFLPTPLPSGRLSSAGLGEGVPPGNYGNYGYPNSGHSACEEENERLTESLRNKVTVIKSLSIETGHEVKHQNKLLVEMDSRFDSTTGFIGKTMGKLKLLSRGSQTKLLCCDAILIVFFVIHWIIKLRWYKSVWVWNLFQLNSLEYHISKKKKISIKTFLNFSFYGSSHQRVLNLVL